MGTSQGVYVVRALVDFSGTFQFVALLGRIGRPLSGGSNGVIIAHTTDNLKMAHSFADHLDSMQRTTPSSQDNE
eukprot:3461081-Amphidinium_carterae.1